MCSVQFFVTDKTLVLRRLGDMNATWVGTGFEGWIGLLPCKTQAECVETSSGNPGLLATCVKFTQPVSDDSLPAIIPEGQYCVCNIAFERTGIDCESPLDSPYGAILGVTLVFNVLMVLWLMFTIIQLCRRRLMSVSIASINIILCFCGSLSCMFWGLFRMFLHLGHVDNMPRLRLLFIYFSIAGSGIVLTITIRMWNQVLHASTRTLDESQKRGISASSNWWVTLSCWILSAGIMTVAFIGWMQLAATLAFIYFLGLIIVYRRTGIELRNRIRELMLQSNSEMLQQTFQTMRLFIFHQTISTSIFLCMVVIYFFNMSQTISSTIRASPYGFAALLIGQIDLTIILHLTAKYASDILSIKSPSNSVTPIRITGKLFLNYR